MKENSKSKWRIINIVCIIASIVCIILTFWGNLKNDGVLTTDAYVGIIGTLIGVCTTLMVGFQIFNYFEFRDLKSRVNNIDIVEENIKTKEQQIKLLYGEFANVYMSFILKKPNGQNINLIEVETDIPLYVSAICFLYTSERYDYKSMQMLYDLLNQSLKVVDKISIEPPYLYAMRKLIYDDSKDGGKVLVQSHFAAVAKIDELIKKSQHNNG